MTQISGSSLRSDRNAICVPSGDHEGSKSGPGECVSRVRSVPSALMVHTSSKLSNAIRPESEESEMDPPPLLGPEASDDDVAGVGSSAWRRSHPPLHPPTTMTTAREGVRMRHLMSLSTLRLAG